jgi:hypothetical protein
MLIIRKSQMDALDAEMLSSFQDRMIAHLRALFPARTAGWGATSGRGFVLGATAKARTHHVIAERAVARFIDLMAELGDDFETRADMAWATEILASPDRGGTEKMDAIYQELGTRIPSAARLQKAWPETEA